MSDYEVLKQTAEQYIRDISRLENAILELRSELTQTWTRHEKERVKLEQAATMYRDALVEIAAYIKTRPGGSVDYFSECGRRQNIARYALRTGSLERDCQIGAGLIGDPAEPGDMP